ncbi:MAG: elongation factor G [Bacteroidales bacterium]|nr:elongation factor G [Bacteroidales bacterium]MBN2757365.1 elongation factor G [Bacteroidales bacterium]
MKIYQTNEIRNLALLGNAGLGKTTLAESMLFEGGVINRRGDVSQKNTVSDYHEIEHDRGSSVFSTVLYTEWLGKKINIIDTPGADDFIGGVISALHVVDTGLMLINAQHGVETGTEIIWRHSEKLKKPIVFVVNQLDNEHSNFDKSLEDIKQSFGKKVVVVQYPVNQGTEFNAVVDVLLMKMYKWGAEGGKPEIIDIPESEIEKAKELNGILIEAAAENDEELMEIFFEKESLSEDQMRSGIRKGLIKRDLFPVFCVSAKKNMGVRRLMEFLGNVAPTPDQMPSPITKDGKEVKCDVAGPVSLFIFKNTIEPHLGEVLYFKVMSGSVTEGLDLINTVKQSKERLSQLFLVAGKNRTKIEKLVAGDIGATVKLKETKTNHTLNEKSADWAFPEMKFPAPKFRTAIKVVNESDDEKLGEVLHRMHEEDPTVILEYSKELKQLILHGQGEFHLNTVKWHLETIHKIQTEFIAPKIPYRETITKSAQADYRHKKQSGGSGQFGEVHMFIEPHEEGKPDPISYKFGDKEIKVSVRNKEEIPLAWGGKLVFYNCIVGGVIDTRFMPAILKGLMEKMEEGPLTGSYARDIRVSVYDGKMHPVDSNEISFKLAGAKAFSDAFKKAGPKILEPIYDMEVLVPSDRMGDVMSDLQGRRAIISGMSSEKGFEKIMAKVPLAEVGKYSTALSSLTNGRATFSMKFAEYSPVSHEIQDELLKAYEAEQED